MLKWNLIKWIVETLGDLFSHKFTSQSFVMGRFNLEESLGKVELYSQNL